MKTKKKWLLLLMIVFVLAAMIAAVYMLTMDPYRGSVQMRPTSQPLDYVLTRQQAEKDLNQTLRLLRSRHAAWKLGDPNAEKTEQALESAIDALPEEVTVLELWQILGSCLHHLEDAHTMAVHTPEHELYLSDWTPFTLYGNPIAINGEEAEQFFARNQGNLPYETDAHAREKILGELPLAENWMNYLGVDTADGVSMTFATPEGEKTIEFAYVLPELVKGAESAPWVSWEVQPEYDAAVFTLRSCVVNEEYETALHEFFTQVQERKIGNVIVDLRGNGGGNSYVANLFLEYLDVDTYRSWDCDVRYGWYLVKNRDIVVENSKRPEAFSGQVYVLTDVETFSAAKDFAMLLADNDLAVHVGQAPGNLPDSYMDVAAFWLKRSGLTLSVTYKYAYRLDRTQSGKPLEPDVVTDDPLNSVYDLISHQS